MKHFALILLTLFFITGCTTPNKQIKTTNKASYPDWYINPLKNDQSYLYGTGSGGNKESAIKNALLDISSKLSLTISSSSNIYKESYRDYREYTQKSVKEDIYTKTEDLTFTDYEVLRSQRLRYNSFAALVKVNRSTLMKNLKKEIDLLYKELDIQKSHLQKKDPLTKYLAYTKLLDQLSAKTGKINILKTLDPKFNENYYFETLNNFAKMIHNEKEKISFSIDNISDIPKLSSILKENITDKGFIFTTSNKTPYILKIKSEQNRNLSHGIYIVENNISIDIYYDSTILKSTTFKTKGASSNSFNDAVSDSIKELDLSNIF